MSDFNTLIQDGLNRRAFLKSSLSAGLFMAGVTGYRTSMANVTPLLLGFQSVAASTSDSFVVPEAYLAEPLISWGDPLLPDAPAHDPSSQQPASAQLL